MIYDAVIVGGGPAGLAAALALGRARKRVLLCDFGPRRNAAAVHIHNFVTRDGTPPHEFRRIGREELEAYPNVEVRDVAIEAIDGERGAFQVRLAEGEVAARRIVLCTGMVDELPELPGFRELWGTSIFQCPYCHGWEIQGRAFGALVSSVEMLEFALLLRGWSGRVVALTDGKFALPSEVAARLRSGGVEVDERPLARLITGEAGELERIEFVEGDPLPLQVLFARPPQRQVAIVQSLGLSLDPAGFVIVDEVSRETSRSGIYAGGDLTTPMQGAVIAAASGVVAASMLNHALTVELATAGALP